MANFGWLTVGQLVSSIENARKLVIFVPCLYS